MVDKTLLSEPLVVEFLDLYSKTIKRDGGDKLLDWLKSSDYLYAPASTRFHGNHQCGLLEHSMNVYKCLKKQLDGCGFSDSYSDETVAIVALMHDVCKVNMYKKGFRNVKQDDGTWVRKDTYEIDEKFPCGDHADKSIIILQNYIRLESEEILAIRAHMGGFDNAVKGGARFTSAIFERSKLALLLHLADMQASYLYDRKVD